MYLQNTDLLKIYRVFKSLDSADPLSIVRFYEKNEKALSELSFDQFFNCLAVYVDALFNAEMYRQHIVMCDHLLQLIISENVRTHNGTDVYQHTLLRKACSHNLIGELDTAHRVIEELIKINPEHKEARHVLATMLMQEQPKWHQNWTATAILSILSASILITLGGIAYIFKFTFSSQLVTVGLGLMAGAVLVLLAIKGFHTWEAFAYTRRLARKLLRKRMQEPKG
jgi:hypothetical protein